MRDCDDPDRAICYERNWKRIYVYRPSWDIPEAGMPGSVSTPIDIVNYSGTLPSAATSSSFICKAPGRIGNDEKIVASYEEPYRGTYYREIDVLNFMQRAGGVCDPSPNLRGNFMPPNRSMSSLSG